MRVLKVIIVLMVAFLSIMFLMKECGSEIFHDLARKDLCESYSQMKFLVVRGKVDSVYEDKSNHSVNTVKVNSGDNIQVVYLEPDRSGLFGYLQANDSIFKEYNSYDVVVKREGEESYFTLDFGCGNN